MTKEEAIHAQLVELQRDHQATLSEIDRLKRVETAAKNVWADVRASHRQVDWFESLATLGTVLTANEQRAAREELTKQAQELDMGYGQSPVNEKGPTTSR